MHERDIELTKGFAEGLITLEERIHTIEKKLNIKSFERSDFNGSKSKKHKRHDRNNKK